MQKPILLGVEGEIQEIVENYSAGIFFEPENRESFLLQLQRIKNPEVYEKLQQGCKKLAQNFDRKGLAKQMLDIIRGCL